MNHFLTDTLPLIGFGLGGIILMMFIKINDLNQKPENNDKNFADVMRLFFRREWAAYGASVTLVVLTSLTHEEWLPWFADGGKLSGLVENVPLGAKVGMIMWGMMGHYLLYKFWLGKMDKYKP